MTSRRRSAPVLLGLVLPGLLLAACGGNGSEEEPTSYLLTDLEGGTAAPDSVEIPDPSTTPTGPTEPTGPTRSAKPTKSPATGNQGDDAITGAQLVKVVAAAAGRVDTVRVSIGNGTPTPAIEAAVVYGETDAFDATFVSAPGEPQVIFRRVQGTFYAGTADGLEAVDPDDPRLESAAGGIVPAFLAWNPLLDLRAALEAAQDVVAAGPGATAVGGVTTYEFDLDLAALPQPSLFAPAEGSVPARATLALDEDDLPVQLELDLGAGGGVVVVDYAGWGERVQIEVPPSA